MDIQQKLEPRQEQRLVLTPQLQQSMHILQLPILELKTLVQQELIQNPMLQESREDEKEEKTHEEKIQETMELDSKWDEYFQAIRPPRKYTREEREKRDFFESSITKSISLQEHLLQQLNEVHPVRYSPSNGTNLKRIDREVAETIIVNIDDDGYFKADIEEIAHLLKTSKKRVEKILSIIQSFDPPGVGARNLQECLLLQLRSKKINDLIVEKIIANHLDDVANKRYQKISSSLNIEEEELREKIKLISHLEPKPGRQYSSEEISFVVPDVIVKKIGEEYKIIVNEKDLPPLRITPLYKTILKGKKRTDKTAKYIREKLNSAMWLLKNIQHRQDTIYKVTSFIIEKQREFLDKGAGHLKVLTLKEVADAVGLHPSTVSRTTSSKYIETPRGIFKLKYFFSGGLSKSRGVFQEDEITSSKNVKNLIQNLIKNESPSKPLSDQKIADILNKQGYKIARRTVAKYREQLDILPSKMRRAL